MSESPSFLETITMVVGAGYVGITLVQDTDYLTHYCYFLKEPTKLIVMLFAFLYIVSHINLTILLSFTDRYVKRI